MGSPPVNGLGPSTFIEKCVIVYQLNPMPVPLTLENFGDLWCFQHQTDPFYLIIGANYVEDLSYPQFIHFKSVYKWIVLINNFVIKCSNDVSDISTTLKCI